MTLGFLSLSLSFLLLRLGYVVSVPSISLYVSLFHQNLLLACSLSNQGNHGADELVLLLRGCCCGLNRVCTVGWETLERNGDLLGDEAGCSKVVGPKQKKEGAKMKAQRSGPWNGEMSVVVARHVQNQKPLLSWIEGKKSKLCFLGFKTWFCFHFSV